jgi:transcriptional regulator with XRE-family HTH domain
LSCKRAISQVVHLERVPDIAADRRVGHAIRMIRVRERLTQAAVAVSGGMSQAAVSRLESGAAGGMTLDAIRAVASALGARIEIRVLWRGAELEKLLDERHARLSEVPREV